MCFHWAPTAVLFQDLPHLDHQITPNHVSLGFKSSRIQVQVGFAFVSLILTSTQLGWKGTFYSSFQAAEFNLQPAHTSWYYAIGALQELIPVLTNSLKRQVCCLKFHNLTLLACLIPCSCFFCPLTQHHNNFFKHFTFILSTCPTVLGPYFVGPSLQSSLHKFLKVHLHNRKLRTDKSRKGFRLHICIIYVYRVFWDGCRLMFFWFGAIFCCINGPQCFSWSFYIFIVHRENLITKMAGVSARQLVPASCYWLSAITTMSFHICLLF